MCLFFFEWYGDHRDLHVLTHSFPTRRSSDLLAEHHRLRPDCRGAHRLRRPGPDLRPAAAALRPAGVRYHLAVLTSLPCRSSFAPKGRQERKGPRPATRPFRMLPCRQDSVVAVGALHALVPLLGFDGDGGDRPSPEAAQRERLAGFLPFAV